MERFRLITIIIVALIVIAISFVTTKTTDAQKAFEIDTEASCITSSCHQDMGKKRFIHEPARDGSMCVMCHGVLNKGKHGFKLTSEGGALCGQCHGDVADKKYKHVPVKDGLCTMCHNPHQSDNPKQLVMPPQDELCFICHDSGKFKGSTPHGPVTEGKCLECHHHHTSDNPRQLKLPVLELCLKCHSINLKDYKGVSLPSIRDTLYDKEMRLHKPFAEGRCIECHSPHPTDTYRRLKGNYPSDFYSPYSGSEYDFCIGCHKGFKKVLSEPRTLTDTGFRNGNLNLHYRHVSRQKGRTCRACHHHHGSKGPKLIRQTFPFGERSLTIEYKKTETGGSCTPTCHVTVRYDRYEPVENPILVTPRQGKDATPEELRLNRERESQEIKVKGDKR